jgi:2-polyprenyl-6-methoxyphenol hydroxylase-like FAD-dependent oxidoreductase
MKAHIIGGGIAGLAAAISLQKAGWQVELKEKAPAFGEVGLGFIILPGGLLALDELGAGKFVRKLGMEVKHAIIRNTSEEILRDEAQEGCIAIKRSDTIAALKQLVPDKAIEFACEFSHFETAENGTIAAAHYKNGKSFSADIYIAADGANSAIRSLIYPNHTTTPTQIKEMVGIIDCPEMASRFKNTLFKTQSQDEGLSVGILPCNNNEIIWYLQYDCSKWDCDHNSSEDKKRFAQEMVGHWPSPVTEIISKSDYNKAFVWFTKDMDLLPGFHQKNLILIGDAAHLALPFTSQGTNSALRDALVLGNLLKDVATQPQIETAFTNLYEERKLALSQYVEFGRSMKQRFLQPKAYAHEELLIPLAK